MDIQRFGVEDWLNDWENEAIYDIAGSSFAALTLDEIFSLGQEGKENLFAQLLEKKMNYGWIEGSPDFKEQVAKLYTDAKPSQILQTNGATGANFLVLYALVEAGDHVISLYPSYQQLYDIPRSFGAEVSLWHIQEKNGWLPSLDELRKLIRPNTKMICINNANNPTGAYMDRAFLQELVAIAREVGAYILSDEVYLPLEEGADVPAIFDLYEKGISTNSISKTYSVQGTRIGWIVSNDELSNLFRKYRDYTMICGGVFDDFVATHVLKNRSVIIERNRNIASQHQKIVEEWLKTEPRVSWIAPRAVSTSFIKLDLPIDTEEFCLGLLKEKGVLLVPGNRFDMPGYARLGYCGQKETLQQGLQGLSDYLRKFD